MSRPARAGLQDGHDRREHGQICDRPAVLALGWGCGCAGRCVPSPVVLASRRDGHLGKSHREVCSVEDQHP